MPGPLDGIVPPKRRSPLDGIVPPKRKKPNAEHGATRGPLDGILPPAGASIRAAIGVPLEAQTGKEHRGEARVVDGDTVEIGGQRLRINRVRAPEIGDENADAATARLQELVGDGEATFRSYGQDVYGRPVGELVGADGKSINDSIQAGVAEDAEETERSLAGAAVGMAGGVAGGLALAKLGAVAGAAAGPIGVPLGAALGFLGGNLGGGFVGREMAARYDGLDSVFDYFMEDLGEEGYDLAQNNSAADVAIDLAAPYALRAAGRVGGGVARGVAGMARRANLDEVKVGSGVTEAMVEKPIKITEELSSTATRAKAVREGIEQIVGDKDSLIPNPDRLPGSGADSGVALIKQAYDQARRYGKPFTVTPWKYLMKQKDPAKQLLGTMMVIQQNAAQRVKTLGAHNMSLSDKALKALPRKLQKKARKLLKEQGHLQLNSPSFEQADELKGFAEAYQLATQEQLAIKRMVGVQQFNRNGDMVDVAEQGNYVFSRLKPELQEALEKLPSDDPRPVVQWLMERGVEAEKAGRVAGMITKQRAKAKNAFEFSRVYDPESGLPAFPEEFYEQNIAELGEAMLGRDAMEITNAMAWGTDMVPHGEIQLPKVAAQLIRRFENQGDVEAAVMADRYFREMYAPDSTVQRRVMGTMRRLAANAMLTKNAVLQLVEVSKGTAYGYDGAAAFSLGTRMIGKFGGQKRLGMMSGSVESSLDEMLGKAYVESVKGLKLHPAQMARMADSFSRTVSTNAALGSVQLIAKEAGQRVAKGKGFTAALRKQVIEAFPERVSDTVESQEQMLKMLGEEYNAGGGVLNQRLYLEGVQGLVTRWHYLTGPGMIANVARTPVGSTALQFRSFMVQAASQFKDDVVKPIGLGMKKAVTTGDASLFHLGMSRLMRSFGHQAPLSTVAVIVRMAMAGKTEADWEDVAKQALNETIGGVAGMAGTGTQAVHDLARYGDPSRLLREGQIFPGLQFTMNAASDVGKGLYDQDLPKFARGVSKTAGTAFPRARLLTEGLTNIATGNTGGKR